MSGENFTVAPPTPSSPLFPDTLSSVTALARFEFEAGKGNAGTKVMMVEWQDDLQSRSTAGSWTISWTGKRTSFPADDNPTDNLRRLYFLLPPGATIPPNITISYQPPTDHESNTISESLRKNVNPLPAIFTPELGATAKASGKKGVLHTIWAKKRLQVLDKEIKQEEETNLEGIALEMAVAEKQWIEQNFGLSQQVQRPTVLNLGDLSKPMTTPFHSGLQSPRSPGGRRLSEKLKGLNLGTSEKDLAPGRTVNTPIREGNPLSPEVGDMAVSSFSAFRDKPPSARPSIPSMPSAKKVISAAPPSHIRQQQTQSSSASLNSLTNTLPTPSSAYDKQTNDDGDDLFAVALSPRSPDVPKSPFSMQSSDVGAFARIKGVQPSTTGT